MILIIRIFGNFGISYNKIRVNIMTTNQAKSYNYLNDKIKPKKNIFKKEPPGKFKL
jgi:hypothetical protein